MPNILFTQTCVRSCPYCFAKKHMTDSSPEDVMSWENLIYIVDFLKSSGEKRFPILGGEPTLHPDFNDMVLYVLERELDITIFTSGIMSDEKLTDAIRLFNGLPNDRLSFVCNINDPNKTRCTLPEQESLKRFLRGFGERVTPGFNIYRTDFDLGFLVQMINEFGLSRNIRLGLTHPIPGKKNKFISIEEIDFVIEKLFSFKDLFDSMHIKPGIDCGFPMCRFNDEMLGWLYRNMGGNYDFGCGPVVDIGPDMKVWSCFPLSSFHQRSIFDFDKLEDIYEYYNELHQKVRTEVAGIYKECDDCMFREENICAGGCLSHSLGKFQKEAKIRAEEIY